MKARPPILAALILALSAAPAMAHGDDMAPELTRGQPKDVRTLINNILVCHHLAGEEGYDAERRKELADSMRKSRCDRLDKDEARLTRKYKAKPAVSKAIASARDMAQ